MKPMPMSHVTPHYICLGMSVLDQAWYVDKVPDSPTKTFAHDFGLSGGGMAATAAVTISRLGAPVAFWGRAGKDAAGLETRRMLADEGVRIDQYRTFEGASTPVAGVIVDSRGERNIFSFQGRGLPDDPGWLPLHEIAGAGAVLADVRWTEGARSLFAAARQVDVPTVLDADIVEPPVLDQLLPLTDHAIFSKPALESYAPDADVGAALRSVLHHGCTLAAMTDGENGTSWMTKDRLSHTPACRVVVEDTTGAGDVYHGAYAYAIGRGLTCKDAISFASAAAALKCRSRGPRAGIPTLDEVNDALEAEG